MAANGKASARLSDEQVALLTRTYIPEADDALEEMVQRFYWALLSIARRHMAQERPGHTLSPTALVNEAWIRFEAGFEDIPRDRGKFMAIASRLMRQVLVDHARGRQREKRGGGMVLDTYTESLDVGTGDEFIELLQVEALLQHLEAMNPTHCRIVECRLFAGMTIEESAEALSLSVSTVNRGWRMARSWMETSLREAGDMK